MRGCTVIVLILSALTAGWAQPAALSGGKWFKIAVGKNGVYRITYDQFRRMGFDPAATDPATIRIFGNRGGMLPQATSAPRPSGLTELSILVTGQEDGVFNQGDQIFFYAEGPHRDAFLPAKSIYDREFNLYSTRNFYFVTAGTAPGRRVTVVPAGSGGVVIDSFFDFVHHESDLHNDLASGRVWYGERFDAVTEHTFTFPLEGILPDRPMVFVSDVMAQSNAVPTFSIFLNGQKIGEQKTGTISNSQYGLKGQHKRDTLTVPGSVASSATQQVRYSYTKGSTGRSTGFLNNFSLHVQRVLRLYGDQTMFLHPDAVNARSRYEIDRMVSTDQIWNVTDPLSPSLQQFQSEGSRASFSREAAASPEQFVAFRTAMSPEFVEQVPNQDLRGSPTPAMVIITHPSFLSEAQRLGQHRAQRGVPTTVVTTSQVYNEFSSGRQDVTAIRDFARHLFTKQPGTLKAVLLFGKGSYDYKDRIPRNTNYVPVYESRNSLSPLETYSSDDYFGFLEEGEGEWRETSPVQNHTLDVAVGRLPVKSPEEARNIVDKIIAYETSPARFGTWRKDIVFVADDGSNADGFNVLHQFQANALAEMVEESTPYYNTRKIFLGSYAKKVSPAGETIPAASEDVIDAFNESAIINYTGHGSERLWADERVLTQDMIADLENRNFPFLVTATCEFGRNDNPLEISSAEVSVTRRGGGSIGLVTTARPVEANTNFALNTAFYEALLAARPGAPLHIGEVFRVTKNNSTSGVANRNFSLLADPFLTVSLPRRGVAVDQVATDAGSDTLRALSRVHVRGRVLDASGLQDTRFNGSLTAVLFDKRTPFETIGKNNPPYAYSQWYNPLFKGMASVRGGEFSFEFVLPRNIDYRVGAGKLSIYVQGADDDAAGHTGDFRIGLSEPDPPSDNTPPELSLFMGDTTFVEGGTVSPDALLVARVRDASGINISNFGIGNTMVAILDGDGESFLLNEHYIADEDDYSAGWVRYPVRGLTPGEHTLTVKVWDTYNNPAEATIRFRVSAEGELVLGSVGNYPNPFWDKTTVYFTHNRPGEDLHVKVSLIDASGHELFRAEREVAASGYRVDALGWNKKLPPGLYLARVEVRSLSDGATAGGTAKLIISN